MLDDKDLKQEEEAETPEPLHTEEETPTPVAEDEATPVEAAVEEVTEVVAAAEEVTEVVAEPEEEAVVADEEEEVPAVAEMSAEEEVEETEEEEVEEEDLELPLEQLIVGSAHDEFDWATSTKHGKAYPKDQFDQYLEQYDATLTSVFENEIVAGRVTAINGGDVVLDINFKSDGLVPLSEFRDMPDIKIGDAIEVYVEQQEDTRGQLVLSRRKAKLLRAWESIVDSYQNGTVIRGTVISKTKGGLIVDCSGLETFLPGSQIDIKPIIDYDSYVGKTMEFKVVKINETIKNAVVSHKALIESDL
ncbi:MAG: S1 RNA-binding domain-containing protein, partial [Saprospiraceae bacterium]|nr:S1 RNA-binding domain-containing protein [Saprospiraceae bacterium]